MDSSAKELKIMTEFITLDSALKFSNIASSGGEAKMLITRGMVRVNGEICLQRGRKLRPGDTFDVSGESYIVV
jgi:ribosome-associated protein